MLKNFKLPAARKRFGQNFLVDENIITRICHSLGLKPNDKLIEIGPGYGALTHYLLPIVGEMDVIELDRDLIPHLRLNCDPLGKLIIHQADALRFDFKQIIMNEPVRIIGNLPYNISTPLLFHLIKYLPLGIVDMHFMLQYELVARITAKPQTSQYGRLSVMLQYFCEVESLFNVPAHSFQPMPKVDSAIIRLKPIKNRQNTIANLDLFSTIVRNAFNMRRKTLRNSLSSFLDTEDWHKINLNSQLRAEDLTVDDYIHITHYLS